MVKYYLSHSNTSIRSQFYTAKVYSGDRYKQLMLQRYGATFLEHYATISKWEEIYKDRIDSFIVMSPGQKVISHLPKNLFEKFQKISTPAQVKRFANEYGNLGIEHLKFDEIARLVPVQEEFNIVGGIEPIEIWYSLAQKIHYITSLYKAIQTAFKEKSELDLQIEEVEDHGYNFSWECLWLNKKVLSEKYFVSYDCLPAVEVLVEGHLEIARKILIQTIKPFITGYIFIDEEIKTNKLNTIGIDVIEHKYTNNLVTVLFYNLWLLILLDIPVDYCEKCNKAFIQAARGRKRKYCSDSCKTSSNRRKKQNS